MSSGSAGDARQVPWSEEAERCVLGALLLDPEALARAQPLRAEHFLKQRHQEVFRAVEAILGAGDVPDLVAVSQELAKSRSHVQQAELAELTNLVPSAENVRYYADILRDRRTRRDLLRLLDQLRGQAYDIKLDRRELLDAAERQIMQLAVEGTGVNYETPKQLAHRTMAEIQRAYERGGTYSGIPSGYHALDEATNGFHATELAIIGARPSTGKSALALNIATRMSKAGRRVAVFSLEMTKLALMQRLYSAEASIDAEKLRRGILNAADFTTLRDVASATYELPLFFDDSANMPLHELKAAARLLRSREKVEVIFVDYLTLISPDTVGQPRHEQVAEISRSLKGLARELQVPVIAASQLRREAEGRTPTMADLRESGSIEQDADLVMLLHPDHDDDGERKPATKVVIAKNRNGPVRTVTLHFSPTFTRFDDHIETEA